MRGYNFIILVEFECAVNHQRSSKSFIVLVHERLSVSFIPFSCDIIPDGYKTRLPIDDTLFITFASVEDDKEEGSGNAGLDLEGGAEKEEALKTSTTSGTVTMDPKNGSVVVMSGKSGVNGTAKVESLINSAKSSTHDDVLSDKKETNGDTDLNDEVKESEIKETEDKAYMPGVPTPDLEDAVEMAEASSPALPPDDDETPLETKGMKESETSGVRAGEDTIAEKTPEPDAGDPKKNETSLEIAGLQESLSEVPKESETGPLDNSTDALVKDLASGAPKTSTARLSKESAAESQKRILSGDRQRPQATLTEAGRGGNTILGDKDSIVIYEKTSKTPELRASAAKESVPRESSTVRASGQQELSSRANYAEPKEGDYVLPGLEPPAVDEIMQPATAEHLERGTDTPLAEGAAAAEMEAEAAPEGVGEGEGGEADPKTLLEEVKGETGEATGDETGEEGEEGGVGEVTPKATCAGRLSVTSRPSQTKSAGGSQRKYGKLYIKQLLN